ncbi:SPOR domain-containing protein [Halalkalibaculum sp. DA384]|uniref:SPOR domain-containing protein n=1 Tax=Halalkalibaculum sp. DA384 TaxID=3373606 RepID=UPI00375470FB
MKINREQLVELLAQKTGMSTEQAEEQLVELISRIHKVAEQEEGFEIEKFGRFLTKEGELTFEPSEELRTEINNKYAGMKPIELIGAYEEPEEMTGPATPSAEKEEDEVDDRKTAEEYQESEVWPEDEDIWGWEDEEQSPESTAEEESDSEPDAEIQGEEEPAADETTGDPGQQKPKESGKEPMLDEREEPREVKKPVPVPEEKPESTKKVTANGAGEQKKSDETASFVMIAAASVIFVAIAVWLVYNMAGTSEPDSSRNMSNDSGVAAVTQQNGSVEPETENGSAGEGNDREPDAGSETASRQEPPQDSPEAGQESEHSEPETANEVASDDGDDSAASSVYGLTGKLNKKANDGYTIVVHSMQNQKNAREIYHNMRQEGYRTILVSAIVNGEKYWRIGLGQFKTIADAQETAQKLPGSLSNNFFIKRIR